MSVNTTARRFVPRRIHFVRTQTTRSFNRLGTGCTRSRLAHCRGSRTDRATARRGRRHRFAHRSSRLRSQQPATDARSQRLRAAKLDRARNGAERAAAVRSRRAGRDAAAGSEPDDGQLHDADRGRVYGEPARTRRQSQSRFGRRLSSRAGQRNHGCGRQLDSSRGDRARGSDHGRRVVGVRRGRSSGRRQLHPQERLRGPRPRRSNRLHAERRG